MKELIETLKSIGLTEGEAKTYLALQSLGTSTVGPIVEKSGVTASKVYQILDRIIRKGLASVVIEEGRKKYTAFKPEQLLDYLDLERKKIEDNKTRIKSIIPMLKIQKNQANTVPEVEVTKGVRGFLKAYNEMTDSAPENSDYLVIAGTRISYMMQAYWYDFSNDQSKKNINQYVTYENRLWHEKDPKIHKRQKRKNYYPKVLGKKYHHLPNITCLGNITLLMDLDENDDLFTLVIRNKNLTNDFKRLIKLLRDFGQTPEGFKDKEYGKT